MGQRDAYYVHKLNINFTKFTRTSFCVSKKVKVGYIIR